MVRRLLYFIQASRNRNWLQHLSTGEAMMQDLISMDRCKYRKGFLVYLADMWELEHTQLHIWNYFLEGNFNVQKSPLPWVAISCDHAGVQVNSEEKSRGELEGNTRNTNARKRQYQLFTKLLRKCWKRERGIYRGGINITS